MKRWLSYLLLFAIVAGLAAVVPLGVREYAPVDRNNRAVEALDRKDYDQAITLLKEAVDTDPSNETFRRNLIAAYNSKAISLSSNEKEAEAMDWYELALGLDPGNQTILRNFTATVNNLAVGHSNARNFAESQQLFERAGRWLPKLGQQSIQAEVLRNYSTLMTLWGAELMKANQVADARRTFLQALDLEPSNTVANIYLGDLHYEVNAYEEARQYYRAAAGTTNTENGEYIQNRLAMITEEERLEDKFQHESDDQSRFNISYVPYRNGVTVSEIFTILAEARETLGTKLGIYPARPVNVKIYETRDFYTVARIPLWAIGIFDGKMRFKVDDIQSAPGQVRDLLFHEYTHAVLSMNIKLEVPAWFHEGMAQLMEPTFAENPREQERMRDALAAKPLDFEALRDSFKEFDSKVEAETAYLLSKYFLVSLNRQYGDDKLVAWIGRMTREEDFEASFEAVYGLPIAKAQERWIETQARRTAAAPRLVP